MLPVILLIRNEDDREFVQAVYLKYKKVIFNKARLYVGKEQDVEGCVQDVVVVLIDHVEECREWSEEHLKNFLMKCIRCIAINKYKENMRRAKYETYVSNFFTDDDGDAVEWDIPDEDENIEQMVISEENVNRIARIIDNMNPLYGDIMYLRCVMNMSNSQIAETLDLPVNTVNQRIFRAKKILEEQGGREINEILG